MFNRGTNAQHKKPSKKMKRILFSLSMIALLAVSAEALTQDLNVIDLQKKEVQQEKKEKITMDQVPAQVKEGFDKSDYAETKVNTIYKLLGEKDSYQFMVTDKDGGNWVVTFSETGEVLSAKQG